MLGYILTDSQKDSIQAVQFAPYQDFNCVQDINDVWFTFLTDEDKRLIIGTEWEWILSCPQGEYIAKPSPYPPIN